MSDFSDEEIKPKARRRPPKKSKYAKAVDFFDMGTRTSANFEEDEDSSPEIAIENPQPILQMFKAKILEVEDDDEVVIVDENVFEREVTPPPIDTSIDVVEIVPDLVENNKSPTFITIEDDEDEEIELGSPVDVKVHWIVSENLSNSHELISEAKLYSEVPLRNLFDMVAGATGLHKSDIVCEFGAIRLYPSTTPNSIGIESGDTLKIYDLESYENIQRKVNPEYLVINVEHTDAMRNIHKIKVKILLLEPLGTLFTILSQNLKCARNEIVIERAGVKLYPSVNAKNIGLKNNSLLHSYLKKDYDHLKDLRAAKRDELLRNSDGKEEISEENTIRIKVAFKDNTYSIAVGESHTIQLLGQLIAKKYTNGKIPRLFFDGELLAGDDVIQDLGLEDGDMLEGKI